MNRNKQIHKNDSSWWEIVLHKSFGATQTLTCSRIVNRPFVDPIPDCPKQVVSAGDKIEKDCVSYRPCHVRGRVARLTDTSTRQIAKLI
jgi:hypothetical protein